jgi:hypothetical protein
VAPHNEPDSQGLTVGNCSGKRQSGSNTKAPHIRTHGVVLRGNRYYYRRRVPAPLVAILGLREIWRSLGTDSLTTARRRSHRIAAAIEQDFASARQCVGESLDRHLLLAPTPQARTMSEPTPAATPSLPCPSFREVYDGYMGDPKHGWSPRTRLAYEMRWCLKSGHGVKLLPI